MEVDLAAQTAMAMKPKKTPESPKYCQICGEDVMNINNDFFRSSSCKNGHWWHLDPIKAECHAGQAKGNPDKKTDCGCGVTAQVFYKITKSNILVAEPSEYSGHVELKNTASSTSSVTTKPNQLNKSIVDEVEDVDLDEKIESHELLKIVNIEIKKFKDEYTIDPDKLIISDIYQPLLIEIASMISDETITIVKQFKGINIQYTKRIKTVFAC